MALPSLIEIVPRSGPLRAGVSVPGSKSITNRSLVLAALASGECRLEGALWSEDTQVMVDALQKLGFEVAVEPDPIEPSNRTITVQGRGGLIPRSGSVAEPLELFVGNAGTAARFLTAMVCLGKGCYRLSGIPRMHERPQAALFQALRELGYCLDSANNKLPVLVHGTGPRKASCCVSIADSSQFASAFILSARAGQWTVNVVGENAEESPYVAMTTQLCSVFPSQGGTFRIEADASSGSYFLAGGWLLSEGENPAVSIEVQHWPASRWQIDAQFPAFLPLPPVISRSTQLGDSIMTAIILAPFAGRPVRFVDLARLRVQECERVAALHSELSKCGARVIEQGNTLEVLPGPLHGATIDTQNDHRMAMCFATLGLKVAGIKIKNPACVKKTFPTFFQKFAGAPPSGLGAVILDPAGRALAREELFAA